MNKASGSDRITGELFQILKDDAVKMLHSRCQQIWKIQRWSQDWKRPVFISIPNRGNAIECSNYYIIAFISHVVVILLLSCVHLFETPWTAACQATLSFTISWSLLKLMSIESVMPSNQLIQSFHLLSFPSLAFKLSHASKVMFKILQARLQQ